MRIFVTGGAGFIGSHLVPLLKSREHQVTSLNHRNTDRLEALVSDFKPEAAVHLAWEGLPDYSWPLCVKNMELGFRIYETLLQSGCCKIITTGTCWEYGDLSSFVAAKTALRLMGEALANEKGAQFIWTRLFFVYGPGQRKTSLIPSIVEKIKNKEKPELKNPNARHDFVYVKDVAKALVLLAEREVSAKIVDIGTGRLHSVGDVAQCVLNVMSGDIPPLCKGGVGGVDPIFADISELTRLGWKPEFDLTAGIRDTLQ